MYQALSKSDITRPHTTKLSTLQEKAPFSNSQVLLPFAMAAMRLRRASP